MAGGTNDHLKLPQDILIEIFVRSSVKCLLRVRCICKQWYTLISSRNFILKHLQYQKSHDKGRLLLQYFKEDIQQYSYALFSDETLVNDSYYDLDHFHLHHWTIHMEGPVNGLYCLFNCQDRIILWNPALMEFRTLPFPQTHLFPYDRLYEGLIGFGIDTSTHNYKLVLVRSLLDGGGQCVTVYNLATNTWRLLDESDCHILDCEFLYESSNSSFINGVYYWWIRTGVVITFDMMEESFRQILGSDLSHSKTTIGSLTTYNDKIAFLHHNKFLCDIWVMVEEGVWIKKISINSLPSFYWDVGLWKNDGLLIAMDGFEATDINPDFQLVLCNANTQEMKNVGPKGMPISFKASIYYESFESVDCGSELKGKRASLNTTSEFLL